ncbi:MAG TPA: hypothetical protein VFH38_03570 [Jatrophihabitans sp.]|nr:hypothetical protein [Jatrophihabitans sp.]
MWVCGDDQKDVLSLRAGAALAGMDAGDLWQGCYSLTGEVLAFASICDALGDAEDVGARTRDMVARAINARLEEFGLAPLFRVLSPEDPGDPRTAF